jgi:hypothetical protein
MDKYMAKRKSTTRPRMIDFLTLLLVAELLLVVLVKTDVVASAVASVQRASVIDVLRPQVAPQPEAKLVSLDEVPYSKEKSMYLEIKGSCDFAYKGGCVAARSGPSKSYERILDLRNGMVLKVEEEVVNAEGTWYKIVFDEWLRYPDRIKGDWYVSAEYGEVILQDNVTDLTATTSIDNKKKIVVDRTKQKLFAYDEDVLVLEANISSGKELTPTPRGEFKIFRKTPSRYMQGPLPYLADKQVYDLPGVPWTLYFTAGGAAIHGTYWHENFGTQHSHGCVNLLPADAKLLYRWADLGTKVTVKD